MSDNIADTERRFEIFVPSPKARINFGARNRTETGPFGYNGISIQSDVHLFIDANKNTLYQTGQTFCGQVGGQWNQFSNAAMHLSATHNVTLAADNRVIIASGAGQGQITALDHGEKMRLVPYNELKLHYVVDSLQTSLFEFFNGRHDRFEDQFGLVKPVQLEHFFSAKNRLVSLTASPSELLNAGEAAHQGGFLDAVSRSWQQLEAGTKEDALGPPTPEAVPWLSPLLGAGIAKAGDDVLESLKYGYSGYLSRFDPYAIKEGGWFNNLHQMVVALKRFFHVALKYGEVVTDLPLVRNAIKGLEAVGGLVAAAFQAYHAGTDSFPALAAFERQADGGFQFGSGGIADELTSGIRTRAGSVESGLADTRQATIESSASPASGWPLELDTEYTMSVSWDGGEKNDAIRISRSGPAPAEMSLTLKDSLASGPETGALSIHVTPPPELGRAARLYTIGLTPANTTDAAELVAAIAAVLPTDEVTVRVADGRVRIDGVSIAADDPSGETLEVRHLVSLADTAGNRALAERIRAEPAAPADAIALVPPRLNADGERERLKLTVDGTMIEVELDWRRSLFDTLADVPNLQLLASVTGSDNDVNIATRSHSSSSTLKAKVGTKDRWTLAPSPEARGLDSFGAAITAEEVVGRLGSLEGASASVEEGKLVLQSNTVGRGSRIEVSGSLADLVFGSASKSETIRGEPKATARAGFTDSEAGFKTLVSWNHELQKLPEDTRNLTRPLTNAISDTLAAAGAVESAVKSSQEIFESGPPPPPEAIGLLSPGGITLGTQDRIVGSGGKGIVFISDGGTGSPDRAKFVPTEGWVADINDWSHDFFEPKKEKAKQAQRSLGFRVLSDSVVDMAATSYAQLAALGRGTAAVARADGRTDVGIGVARVLGSYAAEVAGYEKVVISARNPGKDGDALGATGGRIELLGQRVLVGGVHSTEHPLANGTTQSLTDFGQAGTESFALDGLDGAEHMADGADGDKAWIKHPASGAAWSPRLRALHPSTSHVDIHAATQIEQVVLPFRVQLTKEKAKLGVVPTVEADRRQHLQAERDRLERIKLDAESVEVDLQRELASHTAKLNGYIAQRDNPLSAFPAAFYGRLVARAELDKEGLEAELPVTRDAVEKATQAFNDASAAYDAFSNDWDAKAFPLLEIEEEKIRFGFAAGDGTWEDFAYIELTKDGIKMFQPKSKAVPTFDLAKSAGVISDGTKDTAFEAKNGKLHLKFKDNVKSGPLTWNAQGNVKIG